MTNVVPASPDKAYQIVLDGLNKFDGRTIDADLKVKMRRSLKLSLYEAGLSGEYIDNMIDRVLDEHFTPYGA